MTRQVTALLASWGDRDPSALNQLVSILYDELRRLAGYCRAQERKDHTLGATALLHEAYLRLVEQNGAKAENRAHFMSIAAHVMRCVLVDYARARTAAKRGGKARPEPLEAHDPAAARQARQVIALDDALRELAEVDPEKIQIVELRFFGGFSVDEVAEILGTSPRTVARQWATSKAWLYGRTLP